MNTSILSAMSDPQLMGASFAGDSWQTWHGVLSAAYALPMTDDQCEVFERLAGGREPPTERVRELFVIAGRRSAKSNVSAGVGVYAATIGAQTILDRLAPGETPVVALIAVDRNQARVLAGYVRGILDASPLLSSMVVKSGPEAVELSNGVRIEIFTNSYRAVRGRTLLCAIMDECAFYRSDFSATPDVETYRALLPSLSTTGGLLVGISSPYARQGLLFDKYEKHFGKNDDVLIVQGPTETFNPTIDKRIIEDALADDPAAARAEWLAEFRSDVEQFLTLDVVKEAVRTQPLEIPFDSKRHYFGFCDPSGGGPDSFTLAIGHREGDRTIVDVVRERSRTAPAAIVTEYAQVLRDYQLRHVVGDRYAGSWVSQEFARHGIQYRTADKTRSELYLDALSQFNSYRIELPPIDKLVQQFVGLERRTSRSGKDTVDHRAGQHDDLSNSVAGLLALAMTRKRPVAAFGNYGASTNNSGVGYRLNESVSKLVGNISPKR